ncbi:MAG: hypothetical protein DME42_09540 [Verrucomicrobia bacterium]|nr:MAG: hypothetical protein DME42_09540 [Verrucomicrobiota bacterium]
MTRSINVSVDRSDLGSARVSRVGFGVSPKQSFLKTMPQKKFAKARTPSPTRETRALPEKMASRE